jgi:uncharacterized protein YndB with AHSA1/START domain
MSDYGERTAPGTVRLTRVLPGPIERVLAHITESDKRARWFAAGEMELRVGAPDPTQVAIDIEPAEDGCELVLTHEIPRAAADFRERTVAGWTSILAGLARTLGV